MLVKLTSGGLIYHFCHDPIPLEITMDYLVFTFVDDSDEKLTMETFMVLFIFLTFGNLTGLIALCVEIWDYRKKEKARVARRRQRIAS